MSTLIAVHQTVQADIRRYSGKIEPYSVQSFRVIESNNRVAIRSYCAWASIGFAINVTISVEKRKIFLPLYLTPPFRMLPFEFFNGVWSQKS